MCIRDRFFTALDAHTRASLSPQLSGPPVDECQSATELQVALVRYALASDRNLLLIVDHLEIAPPNLVASLLSAVRAAHTASMDDYSSRLQAIVCGSMLLSQVALRDADRYERISKTITMQDLSREEGRRLLNAYLNNGLTITADAADAVIDWVDGDALLIREAAVSYTHLDVYKRQEWSLSLTHATPCIWIKETDLQAHPPAQLMLSLRDVARERGWRNAIILLFVDGVTDALRPHLPPTTPRFVFIDREDQRHVAAADSPSRLMLDIVMRLSLIHI